MLFVVCCLMFALLSFGVRCLVFLCVVYVISSSFFFLHDDLFIVIRCALFVGCCLLFVLCCLLVVAR